MRWRSEGNLALRRLVVHHLLPFVRAVRGIRPLTILGPIERASRAVGGSSSMCEDEYPEPHAALSGRRPAAGRLGVRDPARALPRVDPLEFLARELTHFPDKGQVTTRYSRMVRQPPVRHAPPSGARRGRCARRRSCPHLGTRPELPQRRRAPPGRLRLGEEPLPHPLAVQEPREHHLDGDLHEVRKLLGSNAHGDRTAVDLGGRAAFSVHPNNTPSPLGARSWKRTCSSFYLVVLFSDNVSLPECGFGRSVLCYICISE